MSNKKASNETKKPALNKDAVIGRRHRWENNICKRCRCERRIRPATDGFVSYRVYTQYNNGNGWVDSAPACQ